MELYLIRHGQTTSNVEVSHAGWAPVELTDLGRQQAAQAGEWLKKIVFDRLYCSDLLRAQQTADIMFPGQKRILDRRMREHGVGILQYQKVSDCRKKYGQVYLDARARDDFSAYQGESAEMTAERVADFMKSMEQVAKEEQLEKVAVVCHEGSIFYALSYALGMKLPKRKLPLTNCSVSKFRYENGEWRVAFWNLVSGTSK